MRIERRRKLQKSTQAEAGESREKEGKLGDEIVILSPRLHAFICA